MKEAGAQERVQVLEGRAYVMVDTVKGRKKNMR